MERRDVKMLKMFSFILSFVILFASCGVAEESNNSSSLTTTSSDSANSTSIATIIDTFDSGDVLSSNTETSSLIDNSISEISIENLLLTIQCNHPNNDDRDILYFLFVLNDGSVYSFDYSIVKDGVYDYVFIKKLYSCDNSAWDYAGNVTLIGKLPQNDADTLNKYVSQIDLTSEYYDRQRDDMGIAPEVVESVNYTSYAYPIMESDEKIAFHIESSGINQGKSYGTYDENAIASLDLIQNSQFFEEWQQECDGAWN